MKKTTLLWDCGTQRIFEEGPHPYAFRTQGYGTPEVLAPLLYLLKNKPDFKTLAVINQDYAWGPRQLGDVEGRHGCAEARRARGGGDVPPPRRHRLQHGSHAAAGDAARRDPVDQLGRRPRHLRPPGLGAEAVRAFDLRPAGGRGLDADPRQEHGRRPCHRHPRRPLEQPPEAEGPGAAGEVRRWLPGEVQRIPDLPLPPHGPGDLGHAGRLRQGDRRQGRWLAERPGTGQRLPRPDLRHPRPPPSPCARTARGWRTRSSA